MACGSYSVDVTAAAFGQCKCGHAKAGHINDGRLDGTKDSTAGKIVFIPVKKEASGACGAYEIDMTAETFGSCK